MANPVAEHGEIRIAEAKLRLATGDPRAATAALAPVLDGSAPVAWENGLVQEGLRGIVPPRRPEPLLEPLSESEVRVLRYLPTNLTTPEIARELPVSPNTVRTHVRHMYAKFGTHQRAETVELACALGLLASSRTGRATARPD